MRKSLSILLAIAMVFTMFAGVAFAADQASDIDRLKAAGVIVGDDQTGDTMDDQAWLRQNVVVLLSRLYGLSEDEAKAYGAGHGFGDVTNSYYDGFITWGKENDIVKGRSEVSFGYGENVTAQELATFLLRVIGIDEWENAIDVAVEKGIFASKVDNRLEITRGDSYNAIVNLLDSEVEDGVTLGASLGLKGWEAEDAEAGVAVIGANQIKVTFDKAVDASDVDIAVKLGLLEQDFTTEWADDKKSVVLTSVQDIFPAGDYTVTVDGKDFAVKIEAQKLVSFTIVTEYITAVNGQTIKIAPLDQYGNIFKTGGYTAVAHNVSKGLPLTIAGSGDEFNLSSDLSTNKDDTVVVTIAHTSGLSQTKNYTVLAAAYIDTIQFGQPEPLEDEARVEVNKNGYVLPMTLINQYGEPITLTSAMITAPNAQLQFISSNNSIVNPASFTVDDGKLKFDTGNVAGNVTITAIPVSAGKSSSVTFAVNAKASLSTLTLQQPGSLVVAGEEIEIGYTATDNYGGAHKLAAGDAVWVSSRPDIVDAQDAAEFNIDDGKIKVKPQQEGVVTISAYVNGQPQGSVTLDVKPAAVPSKIKGINEWSITTVAQNGGETQFNEWDVVILDQYNRVIDRENVKWQDITLSFDGDDKGIIALGGGYPNLQATGADTGTQGIIISYQKAGMDDPITYKVTITVIEEVKVVEYVKEDIGNLRLYTHANNVANADNKGWDFARNLVIKHGKTADNVTVGLSAADRNDFLALTTNGNIKFGEYTHENGSVIRTVYSDVGGIGDDQKGTVSIWKKGQKIGEYEFTLSEDAPVLTSFAFEEDKDLSVGATLDAKTNTKDLKSQYDSTIAALPAGTWFTSNAAVATVDANGEVTAVAKGEATITFVTSRGVAASFKVKVD